MQEKEQQRRLEDMQVMRREEERRQAEREQVCEAAAIRAGATRRYPSPPARHCLGTSFSQPAGCPGLGSGGVWWLG